MVVANARSYPLGEEIANSISHGVGWALAVAGLVLLVVFSALYGTAWHVVSCSIYGASLVMLFTNSTMYHSLQGERSKKVFKILDHSSIFALIAGTYTPFLLTYLRGWIGFTLMGVLWGAVILGTVWKVFFAGRYNWVSTMIYLAMGWCIILVFKPVLEMVPTNGLILLGLGGVLYSLGIPFYLMKKIPYNHALWHIFVLGGAVLQYFSILFYVIPVYS